ncbi:hypothetical protein [Saccharolobus islandicus]|uniref:hypothetical protein n=1 Tax=Saccharolobus islandicus TaxID=43080 RepID=UPI00036D4C62|nr:hypothetical protein [Sulfolobus islandicus]
MAAKIFIIKKEKGKIAMSSSNSSFKLTVIIHAYNRKNFLSDAIQSVARQTLDKKITR